MKIKEMLIPTKYKRIRPGIKMVAKYITIHETDNTNAGADAYAHARLLYGGNGKRVASWHFTVDNQEIYQSLPTNEVGWHAGDGNNGPGNRSSVAIEICVNRDGNFTQAKQNAAWLTRYLMDDLGISINRVVQHNHWSGKNCPRNIRREGWKKFIDLVKKTKIKPQPYDKNPEYHRLLAVETPYMRGEDVKRVQVRLKSKLIDGIYGPETEADVKSWQRIHDEKGNVVPAGKGLVVDGIVGPKTWNALFPKS
jgi:N-acetylmuramoyl-L-alanine amidase